MKTVNKCGGKSGCSYKEFIPKKTENKSLKKVVYSNTLLEYIIIFLN
jgi:hypothetical protein